MTTRGIALAVGLTVPAAWLLWAEHLDAGWQPVLATAGLWWLAAVRATWRVWLPTVVAVGALWLALPPRAPRRRDSQAPAAPGPPAAGIADDADGVAAGGTPGDWPNLSRLPLAELRVLSRTPEGAAVLAAAQEAARGVGARPPEPEPVAGDAGRSAPVPPPEAEDMAAEDAGDAPAPTPGSREVPQDATPAPPRVVVPGSVPAPPRTVWEAFAPLDQEAEEVGDEDEVA